jgi:hypothetical protein
MIAKCRRVSGQTPTLGNTTVNIPLNFTNQGNTYPLPPHGRLTSHEVGIVAALYLSSVCLVRALRTIGA